MLFGRTLCQLKEKIWPKMGNPLEVFLSSHIIICVPNFKNIVPFTHAIIATVSLSRIVSCKCCLEERCFLSRRNYYLNRGIPWFCF